MNESNVNLLFPFRRRKTNEIRERNCGGEGEGKFKNNKKENDAQLRFSVFALVFLSIQHDIYGFIVFFSDFH